MNKNNSITKVYVNKTNKITDKNKNLLNKDFNSNKNEFKNNITLNDNSSINHYIKQSNIYNDHTEKDIDETDIFIRNILKEEENLIKIQIKCKLEEEKNLCLMKEIERSKLFTY